MVLLNYESVTTYLGHDAQYLRMIPLLNEVMNVDCNLDWKSYFPQNGFNPQSPSGV